MDTGHSYEDIEAIVKHLEGISHVKPKIGIICGTGLGGLADTVEDKVTVKYEDIPNFPVSTVQGHAGQLVFGKIRQKPVVCMQGRFHMYEGYEMSKVTLPVRVMKLLGVNILFVTNAAGGLSEHLKVGDMMVIKDHLFLPGLCGKNPLVGQNDERFGPRFPAVSDIYDLELRQLAKQASKELNLDKYLKEGIYVMNGGPSFESIAECRMLKVMGADVVGMSTCPEVIVAAHCSMRVFGMSLVTNQCVIDYDDIRSANHEEVLETGKMRAKDIQNFVMKMIEMIPDSTV